MCKQQKCNSEVGSYLAKSFYLATKTTLRMEHGCVAEPGKTLDFTEIRGYSGAHRGELIAWAVPVLANNFWKGGGGTSPAAPMARCEAPRWLWSGEGVSISVQIFESLN